MTSNPRVLCFTVAALILASACSDSSTPTLPSQLWLALDGDEQHVKLVSSMPSPY